MKSRYCIKSGLILLCILTFKQLHAQDPHFSQYFSSPLTTNPALTGKGISDWRAMANFRSQWWGGGIAPFYTTSASIEKSIATGSSDKSSFGLGISMLTDASNSGLLKNNYFAAGAAYHIAMNKTGNEQLSIGFQLTYANRLLDASKFEFQSQFGNMGFQSSSASGDPVNILSNHYVDINSGVHFSNILTNWGYALGASVYHTGSPLEGVYNNSTYKLAQRYTLQGSMFFKLKNSAKDEIHFSSISDLQAGNNLLTMGFVYKFGVHHGQLESLNFGLWDRFHDAVYPYIGLEEEHWLLGISYDVVNSNVSSIYNRVQSMEISFAWLFGSHNNTGQHKSVISY